MPHQTEDVTNYHEGDALTIKTTVEDSSGNAVDITSGTAEWLLLTDESDSDSTAHLTKDTSGSGVSITSGNIGKLEVYIDTDDTSGLASQTYHHRLRVWDSDDDRATVFTGDFTIEH